MAFLRWLRLISIWVIALMSGLFSLIREFEGIYNPSTIQQKSLFEHCVFIAFIVSSAILWFREHQKVRQLEKDKIKPQFSASFGSFIVAPANQGSIVGITAHITNTGAPSIVKNIELAIEINGKLVQGQFVPFESEGTKFAGDIEGSPVVATVKPEDYLVRNCSSQPIVTGGGITGFHIVFLPNINCDDVVKEGTTVIFSFQDVAGARYEFKKVMSGALTHPLNPRTLQKNIE